MRDELRFVNIRKNDLDLLSYYEGVEFTRTADTTAYYKYKYKFNIEKVYNSLQTNIFQVCNSSFH